MTLTVSVIIVWLLIGLVIGALARLLVPGRQGAAGQRVHHARLRPVPQPPPAGLASLVNTRLPHAQPIRRGDPAPADLHALARHRRR